MSIEARHDYDGPAGRERQPERALSVAAGRISYGPSVGRSVRSTPRDSPRLARPPPSVCPCIRPSLSALPAASYACGSSYGRTDGRRTALTHARRRLWRRVATDYGRHGVRWDRAHDCVTFSVSHYAIFNVPIFDNNGEAGSRC